MKKTNLALLALLSIAPLSHARAGSDTNREIARTFAEWNLSRNEPAKAVQTLDEHLKADPEDSGAWSMLGTLHAREKRYVAAVEAYVKAVFAAPVERKARYRYLQADAELRGGSRERAREVLIVAAADPGITSGERDFLGDVSGRLESLSELPQFQTATRTAGKWRASATVESGYDGNVLLVSDALRETQAVSNQASPLLTVGGKASYRRPWMKGALELTPSAGGSFYTEKAAAGFNSLSAPPDTKEFGSLCADETFTNNVAFPGAATVRYDIVSIDGGVLRFGGYGSTSGGRLYHTPGSSLTEGGVTASFETGVTYPITP